MNQHFSVDTHLCLHAVRTEVTAYRNVALKKYLQNMQTSVSVFGEKNRFLLLICTYYIYIYIYTHTHTRRLPRWLNGKD